MSDQTFGKSSSRNAGRRCHALWAFRARFYDDVSTNSSRSAIIDNKQIGLKPPLLLIIIIYIYSCNN
jgi:hypothetical protein